MDKQRVVALVDGFNLYHAIAKLEHPEWKWLDLKALSQVFLKKYSEQLLKVFFFSALSTHISEAGQHRQKAYLRALELKGVKPILGQFKKKIRKCSNCRHKSIGYEEKETDVNIALYLVEMAFKNEFDRALVISNDSDLAPAIRLVRRHFPEKRVTTIAPPHYFHSNELIKASSDKSKIRINHLERCLLPKVVSDPSGLIYVSRPTEYFPIKTSDPLTVS